MPFVRIDLGRGKPPTIADIVYLTMLEAIDVGDLRIARSADCVFIAVTLNEGRTIDGNGEAHYAEA